MSITKKKRPPSEPPAPPEDVGIAIKVSAEEHAAFKDCADSTGLSLAAWLRQALRAAAGMPTFGRGP